ncbi:uncharacterized protein IL334_005963 [Kwoniella shivajii]|uniref:WSC domain-containing protein n=1 Tax=Kwoniella shivajii TaxID=564305 RepID=A0ABZ1D4L5_9TREE|nr:hypothetical protein IL334_005963 [Kwoniella shivajii]
MITTTSLFVATLGLLSLVQARPTAVQRDSQLTWVQNGCLIDSWNRALSGYQFSNDTAMTQELCLSTCLSKGFTYAGMEYGNQCFCGNGVTYGEWSSGAGVDDSACNEVCTGNSAENCGGDWRLWSFHYTTKPAASSASSSAAASSSSASSSTTSSSTAASSSAPTPVSSSAAASSSSAAASSAAASSASSSSASVSSSASSAAPSSTDSVIPSGWSKASNPCVAEGTSGRALVGASTSSSSMTWQKCVSFCSNAGYSIAGVEYSSECYCGNILTNGAALTKTSSSCNMPCSGGSSVTCGGSSALSLFVSNTALSSLSADLTSKIVTLPSGWSAASTTCVAEGTSGRALDSASKSSSSMTIATCVNYCQGKGYQYAGLEYSSECYCGNDLVNGASLTLPSTGCNMLCSGDDTTYCGGSNALQLYQNPSLAQSLTVVNKFSASGCIQEVSGRALTGASKTASNMTVEICTSFCSAGGFTYAGLEYGSECYCGNSFSNGASTSSRSSQCNMACGGSSSETCGGPNAISLWKA